MEKKHPRQMSAAASAVNMLLSVAGFIPSSFVRHHGYYLAALLSARLLFCRSSGLLYGRGSFFCRSSRFLCRTSGFLCRSGCLFCSYRRFICLYDWFPGRGILCLLHSWCRSFILFRSRFFPAYGDCNVFNVIIVPLEPEEPEIVDDEASHEDEADICEPVAVLCVDGCFACVNRHCGGKGACGEDGQVGNDASGRVNDD